MATFTMELRKIVERNIDIGLNDYPIYHESYRPTLNTSITEYFAYREIGFETIDLFANRFRQKMKLVMPVYNKLYLSTLMEFDPLTTTRIVTESEATGTESANVESTSNSTAENSSGTTSKSRNVSSDFPQSMLQDEGDYATGATDSVSEAGVTGAAAESSLAGTTQAGERGSTSNSVMSGYTMSPSDLVLKYRDTLINVDAMICGELEVLFMQIWNTQDEYSHDNSGYNYLYFGGF